MNNNVEIFRKLTKSHFLFLVAKHSFVLREAIYDYVNILKYSSKLHFVHIQYGSPDYEVKLLFGRLGKEDIAGKKYGFTIGELLQFGLCQDWTWNTTDDGRILSSAQKIELFVSEYAGFIRKYYKDIFVMDPNLFDKLKSKYFSDIHESNKNEKIKKIKESAKNAWINKDYSMVCQYYSQISDSLSSVERKKYEYSLKKQKLA